jgi:hypothetical protein
MDRHSSAASRPAWPTRVPWLTPTKTKAEEVSPATPMRQELVEKRGLDLLAKQVCVEGRCKSVFQGSTERMGPERNELLGLEICLRTCRLHPDIGVAAN